MNLKRFTAFWQSSNFPNPEVWINPQLVCRVEPRFVFRAKEQVVEGSRLSFAENGGQVDVREPIGYVVAALQSGRGGVCSSCYQVLAEAWRSLCDDCAWDKKRINHPNDNEAQIRGELAADHEAAEETYRDMLAHPETVVDSPELFS